MTKASVETYRMALEAARSAFAEATKRLNFIQLEEGTLKDEILRLRQTITALSAMCSESPLLDNLGITETCASVMETAKGSMTTTDVIAALERMGYDLTSQKNAAASVHAVLSRLARQKKIERVADEENAVTTWRGPKYSPHYSKELDLDF